MPNYRLFSLADDPAILSFDEFEAECDEEAIARAEMRFRTQTMELWEAHRKVLRFNAVDGPSPHVVEVRSPLN